MFKCEQIVSPFLPSNIYLQRFICSTKPTRKICIDTHLGTVSVFSSDSPSKYGNARFTTVPLKVLSDQICIRYVDYFQFGFSTSLHVGIIRI